ncbi:MAG TPA: FAD:protein FMN transferase, partial [Pirellula sp.]|nr:FAD:protein FMN transferase [Pirellula sp.]
LCDQWYGWSNGAFDAALGAITRLRRQRKQVSADRWEDARRKSGWSLIELDTCNQAIRFATPGVRFDFGAIGKGIVVDRIAAKLQEMEIEQFVVNSSGNMRIGIPPHSAEGWPIAIDAPVIDPNATANEFLRMRLSRCGVATSGDRWQRFQDGVMPSKNERTSHIIDPKTNEGISGHQSVTIIGENATDADAAATATCVRAGRDLAGWLQTLSENKPTLRAMVLVSDEAGAVRMISNATEFSTA